MVGPPASLGKVGSLPVFTHCNSDMFEGYEIVFRSIIGDVIEKLFSTAIMEA